MHGLIVSMSWPFCSAAISDVVVSMAKEVSSFCSRLSSLLC